MKNAVIALVMMVSAQAFGSVNLDLGDNKLSRDLTDYLAKRLAVCSQGVAQESFVVYKIDAKKHVVDNGVVDTYYTIDLGYIVGGENLAGLEVKLIDWDYSNYETMEQKVSFEISQDHSSLCK